MIISHIPFPQSSLRHLVRVHLCHLPFYIINIYQLVRFEGIAITVVLHGPICAIQNYVRVLSLSQESPSCVGQHVPYP